MTPSSPPHSPTPAGNPQPPLPPPPPLSLQAPPRLRRTNDNDGVLDKALASARPRQRPRRDRCSPRPRHTRVKAQAAAAASGRRWPARHALTREPTAHPLSRHRDARHAALSSPAPPGYHTRPAQRRAAFSRHAQREWPLSTWHRPPPPPPFSSASELHPLPRRTALSSPARCKQPRSAWPPPPRRGHDAAGAASCGADRAEQRLSAEVPANSQKYESKNHNKCDYMAPVLRPRTVRHKSRVASRRPRRAPGSELCDSMYKAPGVARCPQTT